MGRLSRVGLAVGPARKTDPMDLIHDPRRRPALVAAALALVVGRGAAGVRGGPWSHRRARVRGDGGGQDRGPQHRPGRVGGHRVGACGAARHVLAGDLDERRTWDRTLRLRLRDRRRGTDRPGEACVELHPRWRRRGRVGPPRPLRPDAPGRARASGPRPGLRPPAGRRLRAGWGQDGTHAGVGALRGSCRRRLRAPDLAAQQDQRLGDRAVPGGAGGTARDQHRHLRRAHLDRTSGRTKAGATTG